MNETTDSKNSICVSEDFYELKEHGNFEYPIAIYMADLSKMYMGMVRWHWHEELELIIIKKGTASFHIGEESYILSAGQGLIINRNIMHSVKPVEGQCCMYFSIVFHPACIFDYRQTYIASIYMLPIISNPNLRCLVLDGSSPYHQTFLQYISEIVETNIEKKFGFELVTKKILIDFWLFLLDLEKNTIPTKIEEKRPKVTADEARAKEAVLYIQKHYTEAITLDDIADSIHVSKSECCRCIKRYLKMTPFEYLMKFRIFSAAGMMIKSQEVISISSLAGSVGFNSSSYFNKLFRKYMHCTPTEYRSNILNNQAAMTDFSGLPINLFQGDNSFFQ